MNAVGQLCCGKKPVPLCLLVDEDKLKEAKAQAALELEKERAVESLSLDDDPQAIAQCVARTLGIQGAGLKPKDILAKAVEKMPDVPLAEGLPKEQLMQLVGVLVERRAAKRAGEAERAAAAKATAKAEQDEQRAAAEERARATRAVGSVTRASDPRTSPKSRRAAVSAGSTSQESPGPAAEAAARAGDQETSRRKRLSQAAGLRDPHTAGPCA